jgi:hypothetical protein
LFYRLGEVQKGRLGGTFIFTALNTAWQARHHVSPYFRARFSRQASYFSHVQVHRVLLESGVRLFPM